MHRFHASPEACRGETIRLEGEEARHATQVLRLRTGDAVTVLDGAGAELRCGLLDATRREVTLRVVERIVHAPPTVRVTLFQSIPKGRTLEWIVEKATELGATGLVPVVTERTVVRIDEEDGAANKQARWERAAIEAVKQCGNPWLPRIAAPQAFGPATTLARDLELGMVASLESGAQRPRECLAEFQTRHGRPPHDIALWIGPEGDFTPEEYARLAQAGTRAITLGGLVLRSETAAIAALAVLLHELNAPARA